MLLVILYLPSRQEIMHNHDMYNGEHISKLTKSHIPTVNTAARSIVHKKMDDHALRKKKKKNFAIFLLLGYLHNHVVLDSI